MYVCERERVCVKQDKLVCVCVRERESCVTNVGYIGKPIWNIYILFFLPKGYITNQGLAYFFYVFV